MSLYLPDYVRATVGGHTATDYVISYTRKDDLCELGANFTLVLDPNYPYDVDVYDRITITERYNDTDVVLKGYVVKVTQDFKESTIAVEGSDRSILLHDYFIAEQLTSAGETVMYWIERLAGMAMLDVEFEATSPQVVEIDTPLGMQSAAESILKLERQAAFYTKYSSSKDKLVVFRLGEQSPCINITTSKILSGSRQLGVENTRNVVKVFGGYKFDLLNNIPIAIFASARAELDELPVDKTSVIVNPAIKNYRYASIIAQRILSVVGSVDDEQFYLLPGLYPDVEVGKGCYINVDFKNLDFSGNRLITTVESKVDSGGATTTIGIGQKCPRISIQLGDPPIFVTTTLDGVGVSWTGGESFVPSNLGLVGGLALYGKNIAVNQWGQSMVLTADGLYRRYGTGGVWSKLTEFPPSPANNAGDDPPPSGYHVSLTKVVEEPTRYNTFHVMGRGIQSGENRTWVYTTKDFGSTWTSSGIWFPDTTDPSILYFNTYGLDIETSPANKLYILTEGRPPVEAGIYFLVQGASSADWDSREIWTWDTNTAPTVVGDITYSQTSLGEPYPLIHSLPASRARAIASAIRVVTNLKPALTLEATSDSGETWSTIYDQAIADDGGAVGISVGYCLFDYYSTADAFRLYIPGVHYTLTGVYSGTPPNTYYEMTQTFYSCGWDVTIDSANNVTAVFSSPVYYTVRNWTQKNLQVGGGYYALSISTNIGARKWTPFARVGLNWTAPTQKWPVDNTYSDQGTFVMETTKYTSSPAYDAFDDNITWSLPAGRYPTTKNARIYRHAYNDGYYYLIDYNASTPTKMYADYGAGAGLTEFLGEQNYQDILDLDVKA